MPIRPCKPTAVDITVLGDRGFPVIDRVRIPAIYCSDFDAILQLAQEIDPTIEPAHLIRLLWRQGCRGLKVMLKRRKSLPALILPSEDQL